MILHLTTHIPSNCTSLTVGLLSLILSHNCFNRKCYQGCLHHSVELSRPPYQKPFHSVCAKRYSSARCQYTPSNSKSRAFRAVFFGTDDFSLESLKALYNELQGGILSHLDVVSSEKSKINPVRKFANDQQLKLHNWPPQIMDGEFDIGLVVSFGKLIPQHIIDSFPLGMLNVHASLLPRWRGAAPIIYSILNGDKETGVTIMRIKPKRFDIGDIVSQADCRISPDEKRSQLSARLARLGSQLLLETMREIPHCLEAARPQPTEGVTYAPRVTLDLARVNWRELESHSVYNLARALEDLYPLSTSWHGLPVKLFHSSICARQSEDSTTSQEPGCVEFHRPSQELRVMCRDKCWIHFKTIGLPGKKPMKALDFYNGYISKCALVERTFI